VFDKLSLLSPIISPSVANVAVKYGLPTAGYERCVDLRKTSKSLPARVYFRGRHNGINKIELVNVARLGLPRTQEIVEAIFPDLRRVRIYRVDLCVDILGISPQYFVVNTQLGRRQNYALFRSRGAVSFYLQFSRQRKILFYDRGKLLRKRKNPLAAIFATDQLTRIEVQMVGATVPFRRFTEIHRYAEFDPLAGVEFMRLRTNGRDYTPVKLLAAYGLRWLFRRHGQQAASRMFPASAWAAIRKTYLIPMQETEIPPIRRMMRKSIERWIKGQICFPRAH
jgi:hypothetical protein